MLSLFSKLTLLPGTSGQGGSRVVDDDHPSSGSLFPTSCQQWELQVPGRATRPRNQIKETGLHEPHPRLALAIFLNHLWLREVECLLVLSSDDSLDETKSISTANTTEHLESVESIRNQSGFPLSSAEIWNDNTAQGPGWRPRDPCTDAQTDC